MSRIAYVNGHYVPHRDAAVHIEDRGYQFADGVYEVVAVHNRRLVDAEGHMTRLNRSLGELRIDWPMSSRALSVVMKEVIQRNRVLDGLVYIQITRGVAPRDHAFPKNAKSVLVLTSRRTPPFDIERARKGVDVITLHDIRWKRRDIKSISLLPNVLGKQEAREKGAYEAWLV
ncbi:MAG: aminotransferase class IV, partial [Rhodospirillales bacterium]|nr:aminotransferase class IV [Rhodospirillales bacterium]